MPGKRLGVVDNLQSALLAQHIERIHQPPSRQVVLALRIQALGHCPLHATTSGQRQQRAATSKHSTIRHAWLPQFAAALLIWKWRTSLQTPYQPKPIIRLSCRVTTQLRGATKSVV